MIETPNLRWTFTNVCFGMGMKLLFNMTFHPQTDGEIDRVNGVLNQYFKNYVGTDQND
jgi:hypothetical protein